MHHYANPSLNLPPPVSGPNPLLPLCSQLTLVNQTTQASSENPSTHPSSHPSPLGSLPPTPRYPTPQPGVQTRLTNSQQPIFEPHPNPLRKQFFRSPSPQAHACLPPPAAPPPALLHSHPLYPPPNPDRPSALPTLQLPESPRAELHTTASVAPSLQNLVTQPSSDPRPRLNQPQKRSNEVMQMEGGFQSAMPTQVQSAHRIWDPSLSDIVHTDSRGYPHVHDQSREFSPANGKLAGPSGPSGRAVESPRKRRMLDRYSERKEKCYIEKQQPAQAESSTVPAAGPDSIPPNAEERGASYGFSADSDDYYYGGEEESGREYPSGAESPTGDGMRVVQPFTCAHCAARFGTSEERKVHIRNSHGKRFFCAVCKARFTRRYDLDKHSKIVHDKQRPFTCEICDMSFGQKHHLVRHTRSIHMKARDFACTLCPSRFSREEHLANHTRSVHGLWRPFFCSLCDFQFVDKKELKAHLVGFHNVKQERVHMLAGWQPDSRAPPPKIGDLLQV